MTATHDPGTGEACLLLVHRGQEAALPVRVDLDGFGADARVLEHVLLTGDGTTTNTARRPDAVVPQRVGGTSVRDGALELDLPPASWSMVRLAVPSARAGDPT